MSKIIVFLAIFLFAANSIWGQATPTAAYRIANNTTAMGVTMSIGSQVFDLANQKLYVAIRAVPTTITIETGLADPNPYFKEISGITLTTVPSAKDVTINGTATLGATLTGTYTYIAPQNSGLSEGTSIYKWYYATDASGTSKTALSGATAKTYTIASPVVTGNYIAFGVTPVSSDGKTGTETLSAWQKVIIAAPDGTAVVELASSSGRIWMDRNLGASQAATSSTDANGYGSLFQWCRAADGHQLRTSSTQNTQIPATTSGNSNFIVGSVDWVNSSLSNGNLWWNGTSAGANNPCPSEYHIPTESEWQAEVNAGITNASTAYSRLKLTMAGFRHYNDGTLTNLGTYGHYRSSSASGTDASYLYFSASSSGVTNYSRAYGYSVRCIKNLDAPQAQNVSIIGTIATGNTLAGNYTYLPPQTTGSTEASSTYTWYYASDASGTGKTAISGATAKTYKVASPVAIGHYVAFGIKPLSTDGKTGTETLSAWQKVIIAAPDGTTVVDLISPTTGRVWMDRNLGASQSATSSTDYLAYGSLFQWCRAADGHEKITWTSSTAGTPVNSSTSTLSTYTTTGHSLFIANEVSPFDWLNTQLTDGSLWWNGTIAGTNTPCPTGFHVPSQTEWDAEAISSSTTAYSKLKLPMSGARAMTAWLTDVGNSGNYWTSTGQYGVSAYRSFSSAGISGALTYRGWGYSVRCIKNQ